MATVKPKPASWSELASAIYQDLPSEARPVARRAAPTQTPEQAKLALDKFLKEAAERAKRR
jgi:hypothetical protein